MLDAQTFYTRHWSELRREARRFLGSIDDPDDAVSAVLALTWRAWSQHPEWHSRKDRLFSSLFWASRQVRNGRLPPGERRRKREAYRLTRADGSHHVEQASSREQDPAVLVQTRLDFAAWLETIGPRSRQRVLAKIDGCTLVSLARAAGVSTQTMGARMQHLREAYESFLDT